MSNLSLMLTIGANAQSALTGIKSVNQNIEGLKQSILGAGNIIKGVVGQMVVFSGVKSAINHALEPAIEFEKAMAGVRKVVDFDTPEGFKEMQDDILELTRSIAISKEGLAEIVAAGGRAGLKQNVLLGFAKDAATMGVAFDMSAGEAGDAMVTMANVLNKPIEQMRSFGDAINHLSDNANSQARDIVNVVARAGIEMRSLGLTSEQGAGLASTFLAMGRAPEIAAQAIRGLNSAFRGFKIGDKADELAELGWEAEEFAQSLETDAQGTIFEFLKRLKTLDTRDQERLLANAFDERVGRDIALLTANLEEYQRQIKLIQETDENGNAKYLGSMTKEFENVSNTTSNSIEIFKQSVSELMTRIGNEILPVANFLIKGLTKGIQAIADFVHKFKGVIQPLLGGFAGFFAFKFGRLVLSVIPLLITGFKGLFAVFRMSPLGLLITALGIVVSLFDDLPAVIERVWGVVTGFFAKIKEIWDGVLSFFGGSNTKLTAKINKTSTLENHFKQRAEKEKQANQATAFYSQPNIVINATSTEPSAIVAATQKGYELAFAKQMQEYQRNQFRREF